MDDLEHWAKIIPPADKVASAAAANRNADRARSLEGALQSIAAAIQDRVAGGHPFLVVRELAISWIYAHEAIEVLNHRGYKLRSVAMNHTTNTVSMEIFWGPAASPTTEVICGLQLHGSGCSRAICDLPAGHPGKCEAGTSHKPSCGRSYEYYSGASLVTGTCGMPKGHQNMHYSLAERFAAPPAPASRLPVCGECYGDADDVCLYEKGHTGEHGSGPRKMQRCGASVVVGDDLTIYDTEPCALSEGHTGAHRTEHQMASDGLPGPARN